MGPKKGKKGEGKGKKKPDPVGQRPCESMPIATVSAAFAAIRVEFLAPVQELDMIWSQTLAGDFLGEPVSVPRSNLPADLSDSLDESPVLQVLFLDCPILKNFKRPELYVPEKPKVFHPLLLDLRRWEDKQAPILEHEFGLLAKDFVVNDDSLKEDIVYPNNPRFPRTHLHGF